MAPPSPVEKVSALGRHLAPHYELVQNNNRAASSHFTISAQSSANPAFWGRHGLPRMAGMANTLANLAFLERHGLPRMAGMAKTLVPIRHKILLITILPRGGSIGLPSWDSHKLQHLLQTPDDLHHQTLLYYPKTYKTISSLLGGSMGCPMKNLCPSSILMSSGRWRWSSDSQ